MKPQQADTDNLKQKSRTLTHFVLWTLVLVAVISVGLVYQNHHAIEQIKAIKRIGNYYDQAHVISDATRDVIILRSGINDIAREHDAEMLLQDIRRLVLVQDHLTELNQSLNKSVPFHEPMQQLHHEVESLLLKLNAISAYARPNPQNQTVVPDTLYNDYLLAFKNYQIDSEYVIDKLTQSYQIQLNNYKKKYTIIALLTLLAVVLISLVFYRRMQRMLVHNQSLNSLNQQQFQTIDQLQQKIDQIHVEYSKYQTIVDNAPVAILLLKPDETVGCVNSSIQRLFGYSEHELLEQSLDYIMPDADADIFYDRLMQLQYQKQTEQPTAFELNVRTKSGQLIPVTVKIADLYIDNKHYFEITIRDIRNWQDTRVQLKSTSEMLAQKQEELDQEERIAKHVFEKVSQTSDDHVAGVAYYSKPMNTFSGDLLLSSRLPDGSIRILLCDFTGHGLPAALGAIPVSLIHNTMAAKGLPLTVLIQELNEKLRVLLPTNIFCCAVAMDINRQAKSALLWNAGMPPVIVVDEEGQSTQNLPSQHLPLGVAAYKESELICTEVPLKSGEYFYLYTDGIIEAQNPAREFFGDDRLTMQLLQQPDDEGSRINKFTAVMADFMNGADPTDDMTLVEVRALSETSKIL